MEENLVYTYLIFFLIALTFSFVINGLLLKFAKTLGIRGNSDSTIVRWSSQEKPSLGGISFYITFLITIIIFSFVKHYIIEFFNLQIIGIFIAVTIGFLLGLFDDAYNTKPWIKFFTQVLCAIILIITGTYIDFFNNDFYNYFLTVFWVVGIMNSINMLDNMDGITTIVSISILTTILASLFLKGNITNPLIIPIIGTLAALFGFLYYNWSPAKIFMGDTGSQFLGILLAGIGIIYFWNGTDINGNHILSMNFMSVVMAFSLPIIDTTTVFIKRISNGNSPFIGGKDHTTHHLSYIGLSERQVAWVFIFLSALSFIFTILITNFIENWSNLHIYIFSAYLILIFTTIFIIANKQPLEPKMQ